MAPRYEGADFMLGLCQVELGKADMAVGLYERAIDSDPMNPGIWARYHRMGEALLLLGRYEEAIPWSELGSPESGLFKSVGDRCLGLREAA